MKKISADHFVSRPDHVVSKKVDENIMLLNLNNGAYFNVNPVGEVIWESCNGKKTAGLIALEVSRKFKIEERSALKDTLQFINELSRENLVKITHTPTAAEQKK